jgi:hypothetical protein
LLETPRIFGDSTTIIEHVEARTLTVLQRAILTAVVKDSTLSKLLGQKNADERRHKPNQQTKPTQTKPTMGYQSTRRKSRNANSAKNIPKTFVICTVALSLIHLFVSYYYTRTSSISQHDYDHQHHANDYNNHNDLQSSPADTAISNSILENNRQMKMFKKNQNPSGSIDCKQFLQDFRLGKVSEMERIKGYEKPFVTRTDTPKPFYWSLHDPKLDPTRQSFYQKGFYYEKELLRELSMSLTTLHVITTTILVIVVPPERL